MTTQQTGIENMRYDFVPIGTIVPFSSNIIPLGYLECDGREITRDQYPELYDLIGSKLPDYRGMFLRGNDNGRGIDAGRILGSEQGDAIRNITGSQAYRVAFGRQIQGAYNTGAYATPTVIEDAVTAYRDSTTTETKTTQISTNFDASRVVPTAEENRPINTSVNYIIKALHIANPTMEYQVANGLNYKIENNLVEQREAHLNNTGAPIGYNGIIYIQDVGEKVAGYIYYDKLQSGLWYCKTTTSEVVNSDKFIDYSNLSNGSKINSIKRISYTLIALVINDSLGVYASLPPGITRDNLISMYVSGSTMPHNFQYYVSIDHAANNRFRVSGSTSPNAGNLSVDFTYFSEL